MHRRRMAKKFLPALLIMLFRLSCTDKVPTFFYYYFKGLMVHDENISMPYATNARMMFVKILLEAAMNLGL